MDSNLQTIQVILKVAAGVQLAIAVINLNLVHVMRWKEDLMKLPLLIRQVFHVHCWFISITLSVFAIMTWRFALEMSSGTNPAIRWLSAAICMFWGFRTLLQVVYYSPTHWRGRTNRTLIHIACILGYGGLTLVYLVVAVSGRG